MSLVKSKFALLISIITVVLITLGIAVLPQTAYADSFEEDGVTYEIDDSEWAKVIDVSKGGVTIPAEITNPGTGNVHNVVGIEIADNATLQSLAADPNPDLTTVFISGCDNFVSLDVSGNTNLKELICRNNALTDLNVSGCASLRYLDCTLNNLTTLDCANLSELNTLSFSGNKITNLDNLSDLLKLTSLSCSDNRISSLDLSRLANLSLLFCHGNNLTTLDLSANTNLEMIGCENNQLTTLNVRGLSSLHTLMCSLNRLTTLDLTGCTSLEYFTCHSNMLSELDVSEADSLEYFDCGGNLLTSLDVSGKKSLNILNCSDNALSSLKVTGCSNLERLYFVNNRLSFFDLTGCDALSELLCYGNQFFEPIVGFGTTSLKYRNVFSQQSITVAMSHDGQGGYISELSFPRASKVALSEANVSFANGFFVMPSTLVTNSNYESYSGYTDALGPELFTYSSVDFYVPFYSVTFLDYDGTVLETQLVDSGLGAVAPAVAPREGYTFVGWDKSIDRITQDIEVTAVYEKSTDPTPKPDDPSDTDTSDRLANTGDESTTGILISLIICSLSATTGFAMRKKMQR